MGETVIKKDRRKYKVNDNYFSEPNIYNSYWAGFIAGDGNIHEKDQCVQVILKGDDICVLEAFKSSVENTYPIRLFNSYVSGVDKYYPSCRLDTYSKQWLSDLYNIYSLTPRKSRTILPPKLDCDKCLRSFLCGYIDANGFIGLHYGKYLQLKIYCGSLHMTEWLVEQLNRMDYSEAKPIKYREQKRNGKVECYEIAVNGRRAYNILYLLQKDYDGFLLFRKWVHFYFPLYPYKLYARATNSNDPSYIIKNGKCTLITEGEADAMIDEYDDDDDFDDDWNEEMQEIFDKIERQIEDEQREDRMDDELDDYDVMILNDYIEYMLEEIEEVTS